MALETSSKAGLLSAEARRAIGVVKLVKPRPKGKTPAKPSAQVNDSIVRRYLGHVGIGPSRAPEGRPSRPKTAGLRNLWRKRPPPSNRLDEVASSGTCACDGIRVPAPDGFVLQDSISFKFFDSLATTSKAETAAKSVVTAAAAVPQTA